KDILVGYPAFRKDTDAQALVQSSLCPSIDRTSTLGAFPIYQYTYPFIKEPKNRDLYQLFFSDKNKGVPTYFQHQHNIEHTGMVGHQHIALPFYQLLFPAY